MELKIINRLPDEFKDVALDIYIEALRDKIIPLFGDTSRAIKLLKPTIAPDRCMVAIYNDELAGIIGIQTLKGGFLNPTFGSMLKEYGVLKGSYKFIGLMLLHRASSTDKMYMDGIAVAENMRGKGIGTELIASVEKLAREKKIKKLALDVIDTNPKAHALYSRLGFVETKNCSVWPFDYLYGFSFKKSYTMEKTLSN